MAALRCWFLLFSCPLQLTMTTTKSEKKREKNQYITNYISSRQFSDILCFIVSYRNFFFSVISNHIATTAIKYFFVLCSIPLFLFRFFFRIEAFLLDFLVVRVFNYSYTLFFSTSDQDQIKQIKTRKSILVSPNLKYNRFNCDVFNFRNEIMKFSFSGKVIRLVAWTVGYNNNYYYYFNYCN